MFTINRSTNITTKLTLDISKIDLKEFIKDLQSEGINLPNNINKEKIIDFFKQNEANLFHIFYVLNQYGYGSTEDLQSDDSKYWIDQSSNS
jgi:hypothetical protein